MNTRRVMTSMLFLVFAMSGFSGLIYESVWSHYLKLFLGHAAYAQTLVLIIFMGGMAIGSWLAGKYSSKLSNLLLGYAVVEGLVGVAALLFHSVFTGMTDFAFDSVLPNLSSIASVQVFKWGLAALLVLPQSVLLGMTFPLMSAGYIRRFPEQPGASLAVLYFCNSLGAAIGVLVSGFGLIGWVGLPGTMMTAGLINLLLALLVWAISKGDHYVVATRTISAAESFAPVQRFLLLAAAITGLASFFYEIGWIRMLSMVLGSSTHAFELMLSAFILGLALGGYWIKSRIERIVDPIRFLGWIQIVMGMLAISTLALYGNTFDAMSYFLKVFGRTQAGYDGFNVASHAIALFIMLPTTFCAGMTLPLMTYVLFRQGGGERAIGNVYAANTIGSIVGVIGAVHLIMPSMGVKGVIVIGGSFDFLLGLVLLYRNRPRVFVKEIASAAAVGVSAVVATVIWVKIDPHRIISGVYRTGFALASASYQILSVQDGKTATISLIKDKTGTVTISTNGKPDASIKMSEGLPSPDESTMVLAGALALSLQPQAYTAANIGFGSGLTSHVMLSSPQLKVLDTIEIEPAMVENAKLGFESRVARVFDDPRSKIHIEDAKTFFSTTGKQYDIIVSEPSNPWVSGVASLFSSEFYRAVLRHLSTNGILVQWIQSYEMNPEVIASIVRALSPNFSDYAVYLINDADILLVARKNGKIGFPSDEVLEQPQLKEELRRVFMQNAQDVESRRLGGKSVLEAYFKSFPVPANSDFFPYVDLNAPKHRFMNSNSADLNNSGLSAWPILDMLDKNTRLNGIAPTGGGILFSKGVAVKRALAIHAAIMEKQYDRSSNYDRKDLALLEDLAGSCSFGDRTELLIDALFAIGVNTTTLLSPNMLQEMWQRIGIERCVGGGGERFKQWYALMQASNARDGASMAKNAESLLATMDSSKESGDRRIYLLGAAMLGNLAVDQPGRALEVWMRYKTHIVTGDKIPSALSLMALLCSARAKP